MGIAGGSSATKEKAKDPFIDDLSKMTTNLNKAVGELELKNDNDNDVGYKEPVIREAQTNISKKANAPKKGLVLGKRKPKD